MASNSDFNLTGNTPAAMGQGALYTPQQRQYLENLIANPPVYNDVYGPSDIRKNPMGTIGQFANKGLRFFVPGTEYLQKAVTGSDPLYRGAQNEMTTQQRLSNLGAAAATMPLQAGALSIGGPGFKGVLKALGAGTAVNTLLNPFENLMKKYSPTGATAGTPQPKSSANTPGTMSLTDFQAMQARNMADVKAQVAGRSYIENMQLSPAETLAYDQAIEQLRRSAGQAAASSALSEKQTRAEANRGIADIRAFTSGATQDVLSGLAGAGMGDISAGGMGAQRGLAAREATGVADVKQNLADWLAKQKLAAGQRGSDVSYGTSAINRQRAADLLAQKEAEARFQATGRG